MAIFRSHGLDGARGDVGHEVDARDWTSAGWGLLWAPLPARVGRLSTAARAVAHEWLAREAWKFLVPIFL
jgi:hypothetical protein